MIVEDLMINSDSGDGKTTLVLEDNGRVCYCYLLENGEIRSDLWLYNRDKTPDQIPWKSGESPPYLNPIEYAKKNQLIPSGINQISIDWIRNKSDVTAHIYIGDILIGVISSDTKPGFAKFAAKNGPLANVLPRGNS